MLQALTTDGSMPVAWASSSLLITNSDVALSRLNGIYSFRPYRHLNLDLRILRGKPGNKPSSKP